MVKRCAFYVEDGKIIRRDCYIKWNKGFTKEAKINYIQQIRDNLLKFGRCIDVTTASPYMTDRSFSPYFTTFGEKTVEQFWLEYKKTLKHDIPGAFDFIYLNSLTEDQIAYALTQDGYSDVFFNPDNGINTQAKALAVLKLLHQQGKYYLLNDVKRFSSWYKDYCVYVKVEVV